jgi:hypothetical protein
MIFETNESGKPDLDNDKKIGGTEPLLINYNDLNVPVEFSLALSKSVQIQYRMMRTTAVNFYHTNINASWGEDVLSRGSSLHSTTPIQIKRNGPPKILFSGYAFKKGSGPLGGMARKYMEINEDLLLCVYPEPKEGTTVTSYSDSLELVMVIDTDTLVMIKKSEKTDQQLLLQRKLEQSTRLGVEEDTWEDEQWYQDDMFNVVEFKRRQIEKRGPIMPIEEIYPHYVKAAAASRAKYNPKSLNVKSDWTDYETTENTGELEQTELNGTSSPTGGQNGSALPESKRDGAKNFTFTVQCQLAFSKKKELKPNSKHQFQVGSEKEQQQWTSALTQAILNEEVRKDLRDPQEEVLKKIQPFSDFFYLLTGDEKSGVSGTAIVNCFNSITLSIAEKMVVPLLTVFDTAGSRRSSVDLIKSAITAEIENASSAGTLFRRNSLSSKLVTLFFKLYGLDYLRQTVGSLVREIIIENKNYEIDDGRVQGSPDVVQRTVEANGVTLSNLVQSLIDRIISRSETHEIRLILAHSLVETRKHFPDAGEICVGGLLFLRFFCPAILTPQQFGLVSESMAPPSNALRTLTLVTKALQNIANQINIVDNKKEAFMSRLQRVMEVNIDPLKNFLVTIATYTPVEQSVNPLLGSSFRQAGTNSSTIIPDTIKLKCLTLLNYFFQEAYAKKMFKAEKDDDKEVEIAYVRFAETLSLIDKEVMEQKVKELRSQAVYKPAPEPVSSPVPILETSSLSGLTLQRRTISDEYIVSTPLIVTTPVSDDSHSSVTPDSQQVKTPTTPDSLESPPKPVISQKRFANGNAKIIRRPSVMQNDPNYAQKVQQNAVLKNFVRMNRELHSDEIPKKTTNTPRKITLRHKKFGHRNSPSTPTTITEIENDK